MITLNGFKAETPKRSASVAIGTVLAIVFLLCAIAFSASAQTNPIITVQQPGNVSSGSGGELTPSHVQESFRFQEIMTKRAQDRYQICRTQQPEGVCTTEYAATLHVIYQRGSEMRGVTMPTIPPPGSNPYYAGSGTTTCRWVGREWMCDYPGGRTSTCRWVGQNWTCS